MGTNIDALTGAGVVAAPQSGAAPLTVFAAPSTGTEFNTLGERLVPKGCFKVEDLLFDFDSSFVRPEIGTHLPQLTKLRNDNKVGDLLPPLSIFGHADPVGDDDINKKLSGRRAIAMYAMLVRDVDLWEELFSNPAGNDVWGTRAIQTMLSTVQAPIGIDGKGGEETKQAVKSFQASKGLTPQDGVAGVNTRKALFRAYMDALCGPQLLLDKEKDFLARHADGAGLKGDVQGCGEFNPLMMFSKQEAAAFEKSPDKTARNKENAPNRRVMILLFSAGRRVNPAAWPCPRAKDGVAECKKRFFPDAANRRSFQTQRREFETTKDTFACRFYQVISDGSPCERVKPLPPIPPIPPPIPKDAVLPLIFFRDPEPEPVAASSSAPATGKALADSPAKAAPVGAPAIAPATRIVVVKKPYMPTARVDVDLKTDKPFDGNGTFTLSSTSKIRFFLGPKQLQFDGKDNVFTGAELQVGVTLFAEGAQASAKVDDVELTLTLSGGSKPVGSPAKAKMTAMELTLDIIEPIVDVTKPATPLAQPAGATAQPNAKDKVFGGRALPLQNAKKTNERAQLIIRQIKPNDFDGKLVLTALSDQVQLFNDGAPVKDEQPLAKRLLIPASQAQKADRRFFVEGAKVSPKVRDTGFKLGLEGIQEDADKVSITVLHAEIVSTVRPADVKTVALVPEKPERKTKSPFFPAPIIIGVNYDVSMRPHLEMPPVPPGTTVNPLKVTWFSHKPAADLAVTDANKEIVKLKAKKPSATLDDTIIDMVVDTDFGKFKVTHRLTRVNVEINPVQTKDNLFTTDPINKIINPSATIILDGTDALDGSLVAKVEITKMEPDIFKGSDGKSDDDERISWWIIGGEAAEAGKAKYEGKADFQNVDAAKRGVKIRIAGSALGDILVQPHSGGFGYGMFRSHVVALRKLKYRVNRLFTLATPASAGQPKLNARAPTQSHTNALDHIAVANIYLRQAGFQLIPDDSALVASSGGTAGVGVKGLNKRIVTASRVQAGHFDVQVNREELTFKAVTSNAESAVRINGRNAVISFAYVNSLVGTGALAVTELMPACHVPGRILRDKGIPSSALIKKTGIPGSTPVSEVRMKVLPALLLADTPQLWGIVVPTTSIDKSVPTGATADRIILSYANTLAHEVGHVLGLGHRGDLSDDISDALAIPKRESLMAGPVPPPDAENLDVIQVKAMRKSEVLNHNP